MIIYSLNNITRYCYQIDKTKFTLHFKIPVDESSMNDKGMLISN